MAQHKKPSAFYYSFTRMMGAIVALLLLIPSTRLFAQNPQEVKGTVTDSKGNPAAGVTVGVKGGTGQAVTNEAGNFTIRAPQNGTLTFSSIGFESAEAKAGSGQPLSISLKERASQLNDVVVVGYGKSSRKNLSSAISSVKPEDLNRGAISDVGQLLQGKVPGLNISASGDPNRPAAVILRGASTVNSPGGPYYVIDGVPGADIATIAPDDIASIDVLKDAAATAIYGNRAANGIIIVTTKRGRRGQTQISYNGYVGVEDVSGQLEMMNADQLRAFLAKNNSSFTP